MEVSITNFGATVVTLKVPDRAGKAADIVLGYDTLDGYENGTSYFGATVGRYGNRIAGGKFSIDGKTYTLPRITARTLYTAASSDLTRGSGRRGKLRPRKANPWR